MKKFSAVALFTLSSLAFAETRYQLDTIEVTDVKGNKDEKNFIESNESISVLKPKNLNRGDTNNSVQMLNGLGNVQTQSDKNGDTFSIRGVSDMGVTGYQKDNLSSIIADDIFQTPLAIRAGSFENWDLEQIELYRGPQSTTQGVNSLAGSILLYHTTPTDANEGAAKLTLGNFGRKELAVLQNVAVNDKVSVRVSVNKEMTDGYIKNATTNNDKWGAKNKDHAMLDLVYRVNETDNVRLFFKVLRTHRGGSYVQDVKKLRVTEDQDYNQIANNQQIGLIFNKKLSDSFSNKTIFGVTRGSATTKNDEDGQPTNIAGTRFGNDKDQFFSFENQLKYKSEKIKNVLGLHAHRYHSVNHYAMNLMIGTPGAPNPTRTTQEDEKTRETYAIFDSFTYNFTKQHALTLGGRFEVVKNQFGIDLTNAAMPTLNGFRGNSVTNTIVLPKAGYTYIIDSQQSLGATYSQGYRTGGVSVNRLRGTVNEYDPEKTNNYELSYKFMREKFLFMANAFYTKWKDQQVEIITTSIDTVVRNAAQSELYGAEIEGSYEFENADSVRLNVGYVHTQFLSFKDPKNNFTGNFFPDAATVTAQASYWKVLNDSWKAIITSRYVGKSYTDVNNIRTAPEQFYTDFNTQYNFSSYMLELYVRNLFDQQYRLVNGAPRTATNAYQANYHRVSTPQEFGARLNYYW